MKPKSRKIAHLAMTLLLVCGFSVADAQMPDCGTGQYMYGVFTNVQGSTFADSTEIRPVAYATGNVGNLVANRRFWVRKQIGATWYYGASAMAVDIVTSRYYLNTQMGNAGGKDFITIDGITGAQTIIGTTAAALDNYHFVKMAFSPSGIGYALGIKRDTNGVASTFSPLIRFSTCGPVPTPGCSTIELLGYLPDTGVMYKWKLFNGDIAFDAAGNMYFMTAAFERVGTIYRYTDARMFRVDAANIPSSAGTGTIPMSLLAEYDGLDSTVVNGISLDNVGSMYISTRRFAGVQTSPPGPSTSELYSSPVPGTSVLMPGFVAPPNFAVGDISSCYFPLEILDHNKITIRSRYETGNVNIKWEVYNNDAINYFEVQRSNDGYNFTTIATVSTKQSPEYKVEYSYNDPQSGFDHSKFYRIKQVMKVGNRFYSDVNKITFGSMRLQGKIGPNPFNSHVDLRINLKTAKSLNVQLRDASGRTVVHNVRQGNAGENHIRLGGMAGLRKGLYIVEISTDDEVIREKLVKQ